MSIGKLTIPTNERTIHKINKLETIICCLEKRDKSLSIPKGSMIPMIAINEKIYQIYSGDIPICWRYGVQARLVSSSIHRYNPNPIKRNITILFFRI